MRKDKPCGFLQKNLHPPSSGSIFLQKSLHFRQPHLKKPLRVMTLKNCLKHSVNELYSLTQLKCKLKPGLKLFVSSSEFRTKHYLLTFCKPFLGRDSENFLWLSFGSLGLIFESLHHCTDTILQK